MDILEVKHRLASHDLSIVDMRSHWLWIRDAVDVVRMIAAQLRLSAFLSLLRQSCGLAGFG